MATNDFSMGVCSPNSPQIVFPISQDCFLELVAILSAYSDLAALMDSGLPEYVFLQMLNDRFSGFVLSLPPAQALPALAGGG